MHARGLTIFTNFGNNWQEYMYIWVHVLRDKQEISHELNLLHMQLDNITTN